MLDMSVQNLINTGMAWRLEGSVGRACMSAIENGDAILGISGKSDYYGNYVPSRFEVKRGTKGSIQYANKLRSRRGLRPLRGQDFDRGWAIEDDDYDGE